MTISFEFSTQPHLLEQYYKLREECFRKELGLDGFDGAEDAYDLTGNILIVRDGARCIGGIRITGCSLSGEGPMPLERKGLQMTKLLPKLNLELAPSCQHERLVLQSEYRNTEMLKALCVAIIRGCASLGYHYAINVTGLKRARLYKRLHSTVGYDYEIFDQVEMPVDKGFAHLEHLLSIAYIPQYERETLRGAENEQIFAGIWESQSLPAAA